MAIIATAIAASTIIFTSHALPDHRVNFYLFIKTCKCQILAIYLAACSSGWFWPKYLFIFMILAMIIYRHWQISNYLSFSLSKVCCVLMFWFKIPTWENPGGEAASASADRMAPRFGWFWTGIIGEGGSRIVEGDLLISAKLGNRIPLKVPSVQTHSRLFAD